MRAGAVQFLLDVVAGAVREVCAEAGVADYIARRVVGLKALDRAVLAERGFDRGDGGIARIPRRLEDLLLARRGRAADDAGPGDVVVDAGGRVNAAPDINEDEVALADRGGALGGGLVVRVGAGSSAPRSPVASPVTPGPIFTIVPAGSWPSTIG